MHYAGLVVDTQGVGTYAMEEYASSWIGIVGRSANLDAIWGRRGLDWESGAVAHE